MDAIRYLDNQALNLHLEQHGKTYRKTAETLLRLPSPDEIGKTLITLVKDGDFIRQESSLSVAPSHILARNPQPICTDSNGNDIFNDWAIEQSTVVKNYGQATVDGLTHQFVGHKKLATVQAIELTGKIMELLGVTGETLLIQVEWSKEPMVAVTGDYLTSGGYSISQHDMRQYECI